MTPRTTPRIARVPHTAKPPQHCPHCGGSNLSREGTRRKKLEIVQVWRCFACKRTFTPGPAALRNKTYPLRMILSALTDYDTGFTLEETAARLKKKTHWNERWSHLLRQPAKVDSPIQRTNHHEDAETVFG